MAGTLEDIEKRAGRQNYDSPPLHLWHPSLSGHIDILITADGSWYHEGAPIGRESLVRLFASILRREDDGEYYLVTPLEKWRIQVELHPLIVTDVAARGETEPPRLQATLNTGKTVDINARHNLFLEPAVGDIPVLRLDNGLTALLSRAAWYRLADMAQERDGVPTIVSGDYHFALEPRRVGGEGVN